MDFTDSAYSYRKATEIGVTMFHFPVDSKMCKQEVQEVVKCVNARIRMMPENNTKQCTRLIVDGRLGEIMTEP